MTWSMDQEVQGHPNGYKWFKTSVLRDLLAIPMSFSASPMDSELDGYALIRFRKAKRDA